MRKDYCVDCGSKKIDDEIFPTLCEKCRKKMKKRDNDSRCASCGVISNCLEDVSELDGCCSYLCSSCRIEAGYDDDEVDCL